MTSALITILAMSLVVALVAFIWWFIDLPPPPTVVYTEEMPTWNFSYRTFQSHSDFKRSDLRATSQSEEWQAQMLSCGKAMKSQQVKAVFFVHGTFVGDDPWGIVGMLKTVYPVIEKQVAARVRRIIKRQADLLVKDLGNYTEHYVQLYETAIGGDIPCHLFRWSGGNHHCARLQAAVQLAERLAEHIRKNRLQYEDRILIYGHSHAGQVYALLAQLIEYESFGYKLRNILHESGENVSALHANIALIKQITVDFVTFGTPVIYTWPDSGYYRLLNIVNHRGSSHLAGSLKGLLHTKDGDYIQQLGILGTDLIASTAKDRVINKKLDELFGKGRDLKQWKKNLAKKMRISPHGKTFLVNYKDHSRTLPNFVKTMFGHGVYTRYEAMLFNTLLVSEYLYQHDPR